MLTKTSNNINFEKDFLALLENKQESVKQLTKIMRQVKKEMEDEWEDTRNLDIFYNARTKEFVDNDVPNATIYRLNVDFVDYGNTNNKDANLLYEAYKMRAEDLIASHNKALLAGKGNFNYVENGTLLVEEVSSVEAVKYFTHADLTDQEKRYIKSNGLFEIVQESKLKRILEGGSADSNIRFFFGNSLDKGIHTLLNKDLILSDRTLQWFMNTYSTSLNTEIQALEKNEDALIQKIKDGTLIISESRGAVASWIGNLSSNDLIFVPDENSSFTTWHLEDKSATIVLTAEYVLSMFEGYFPVRFEDLADYQNLKFSGNAESLEALKTLHSFLDLEIKYNRRTEYQQEDVDTLNFIFSKFEEKELPKGVLF